VLSASGWALVARAASGVPRSGGVGGLDAASGRLRHDFLAPAGYSLVGAESETRNTFVALLVSLESDSGARRRRSGGPFKPFALMICKNFDV
jgi:hypothetical protein